MYPRRFFAVLTKCSPSPEFHLIATGSLDTTKLGIISDILSLNPLHNDLHAQVPSNVEDVFYTFQNDDWFIFDSDVVGDIWLGSDGCVADCSWIPKSSLIRGT